MTILVVCHYGLYQDFTASFVHNQERAIAARGHRIRVIVPVPLGKRDWKGNRFFPLYRRQEADGVELRTFRYISLSHFGKGWWNFPNAKAAMRLWLNDILKDFSPDIIHAHTLGSDSGLGAWLKKRLGVPLVVTTHGSDTFVPFAQGKLSGLKRSADQADHLVCVSTLLKRRLEDCNIAAPMSVILNGFQVKNAAPDPDKPPLSIIQVGYLVPRKKADVTIRAFAALRKRHPDAILDIVGSGSEMERFQALCGEFGVSESVRFRGFLPNPQVLDKLAKARFFVMPSVNEGFGIVYLEAMASGCVTIGTEGEGIADLIVSGENGFLVPPDDPDAIVRIIEQCLEHPKEADAIAERGRRDALGLTWEKNAAQYIQLFEKLREREQSL